MRVSSRILGQLHNPHQRDVVSGKIISLMKAIFGSATANFCASKVKHSSHSKNVFTRCAVNLLYKNKKLMPLLESKSS